MRAKPIHALFFLAILPFLASCYFTSANPLPPAAVDPALLGLWRSIPIPGEKDSATAYLLITALDQRIWITIFEDPFRASEMYLGYCSEVKGLKYLSVQRSKPDRAGATMLADGAYYLARYSFDPAGKLEIRLMNDDLFRKAVSQKRLAGEITRDTLHLTADSEALALFLQRSKPAKPAEDDRLLFGVKIPLPAPAPHVTPVP